MNIHVRLFLELFVKRIATMENLYAEFIIYREIDGDAWIICSNLTVLPKFYTKFTTLKGYEIHQTSERKSFRRKVKPNNFMLRRVVISDVYCVKKVQPRGGLVLKIWSGLICPVGLISKLCSILLGFLLFMGAFMLGQCFFM